MRILLIILVFLFSLIMHCYALKESFLSLSDEELSAIQNDFDENNAELYKSVLEKYGLSRSELPEVNYCDARGLYKIKCPLPLTYTNR